MQIFNPTYLGGGQNDTKRNKCLRNSENQKKKFKKTTSAINAFVTQKIEKNFFKNTTKSKEEGSR